jgi:hypothetical protein
MNPFLPVLLNRGFSLGASGRFLAPDYKQGNNLMVELVGNTAVLTGDPVLARCIFPDNPEGVQEFRTVLSF